MRPLALHHLTFVDDGDQIMVGRAETESYAAFPTEGAELLRHLCSGAAPEQAAKWFEDVYGQPVDMDDFIATLHDLEFVDTSDSATDPGAAPDIPAEGAEPTGDPVRWQRLGGAVFSPVAWVVYAALLAYCVWQMWQEPDLRPAPARVFFTPSLAVVDLVLFVTATPLLLWHEGFHLLAARRLGLASRLGVGRRLYFIVAETSIPGLLGVPRRRRYLPLLAGFVADLIAISALTLVAAALREPGGAIGWPGRLALALAYTRLLAIIWQFFFFLQTDLYHVFTTATRCHNLHQVTRTFIRNRLLALIGQRHRTTDESCFSPRDRKTARWFAPLTAVGVTGLVTVAALSSVPILIHFIITASDQLRHSALDSHQFWDALTVVVIMSAQFGAIAVMAMRSRLQRARSKLSS